MEASRLYLISRVDGKLIPNFGAPEVAMTLDPLAAMDVAQNIANLCGSRIYIHAAGQVEHGRGGIVDPSSR